MQMDKHVMDGLFDSYGLCVAMVRACAPNPVEGSPVRQVQSTPAHRRKAVPGLTMYSPRTAFAARMKTGSSTAFAARICPPVSFEQQVPYCFLSMWLKCLNMFCHRMELLYTTL